MRMRHQVYGLLGLFYCLTSPVVYADQPDQVRRSQGEQAILLNIQQQYKQSPGLALLADHVDIHQHVVQLSGQLDDMMLYQQAITIAEQNKKVQDVDTSRLTVKGHRQPLDDEALHAKILGIFARHAAASTPAHQGHPKAAPITSAVQVAVHQGQVTLSGSAPNRRTQHQILSWIQHIPGVKEIKPLWKIEKR